MCYKTSKKRIQVAIVFGFMFVMFYIFFSKSEAVICQNETSIYQTVDTLFSNSSKIRNCITGDVIGIRPRVPLISFNKFADYNAKENSQERKAAFRNIFNKRIWNINTRVNFSASGKFRDRN